MRMSQLITYADGSRRHAVWYLTTAGLLLIAAIVGLVAFAGFARYSFPVGPARVSTSVAPSLRPSTTVVVPPFGSIRARTHAVPLALRVSLDEVDLPALEKMAAQGVPDHGYLDGLVVQVRRGFYRAVAVGLLAALCAGAFVGWSLRHGWRAVIASAVVAALVPAVLVGLTAADVDVQALKKPTFRGALAYAPSLIELVQRRARNVTSAREQVAGLVSDLNRYYQAPQSFAPAGALEGTYRVLHVTDLHLDPVGFELADTLAKEFKVSLVIDTGDIDNYGSSVEAAVVASQVPTSVPQLYIPGNHDSPPVVAALDALPNVTVLNDKRVEVDGISVYGVADPAAQRLDVRPMASEMDLSAAQAVRMLRSQMAAGESTPTIVALHNPAMATPFTGLASLLLAGHTHAARLERRGETWYLNSGTTGGVDFSKLKPGPNIPHTASVLYFTAEEPRRLIAIDQIEISGLDGESSLKRTVVDESLLPQP